MTKIYNSKVFVLFFIIALGIFTAIMLGTTSYAFKDTSDDLYRQKEQTIIHQAKLYAETLDSLKTEGNLVITLDDMVRAGYYVADDEEGNVYDPKNPKATLNGLKIKLTISNGNIIAGIIEE